MRSSLREFLLLSHVNLAEITAPDDLRHAGEIAGFLEAVLPNVYFALFAVDEAIKQESQLRDISIRLKAPPDLELLREVARQRPDDFKQFTISNLVKIIAQHRDRLLPTWHESNQELADHINNVRKNVSAVKMAKTFKSHPPHLPTLAVMQEIMRPFFLDQTLSLNRNDAADIHHAVMSIVYADYVLLDGKWRDLHARMMRRFEKLNFQLRTAAVFSRRDNGVEQFLQSIASHQQSKK
jgi:hypothetical protein